MAFIIVIRQDEIIKSGLPLNLENVATLRFLKFAIKRREEEQDYINIDGWKYYPVPAQLFIAGLPLIFSDTKKVSRAANFLIEKKLIERKIVNRNEVFYRLTDLGDSLA